MAMRKDVCPWQAVRRRGYRDRFFTGGSCSWLVSLLALACIFEFLVYDTTTWAPNATKVVSEDPADHIVPFDGVGPSPSRPEAYVMLLCTRPEFGDDEDWYFHATRLNLFRLKHHHDVHDRSRPVIVLTTPHVQSWKKDKLRAEGAAVRDVELIHRRLQIPGNIRWIDQYAKLHLWNLTEFERVLYFDADVFLIGNIASIWTTPESQLVRSPEQKLPGEAAAFEYVMTDDKEAMYPWLLAAAVDRGTRYGNRTIAEDFNAGMLMLHPSTAHLDLLLRHMEGTDGGMMEQGLLRKIYSSRGPFPWQRLDWRFNANWPTADDRDQGAIALHHKFWWEEPGGGNVLADDWFAALDEMTDFYGEARIEYL